jgi:MFS superfamily sulfate permease-like transporter
MEIPKLKCLPGGRMITGYQMRWLPKNLMACLVLTAILVPQGKAYAELAGCRPSPGSIRRSSASSATQPLARLASLVVGPDSSLGPMIATTILPLVGADGSPARAERMSGHNHGVRRSVRPEGDDVCW